MESKELREKHIRTFARLSLSERLSWAFTQNTFLRRFLNTKTKRINKLLRRNGKKYFQASNLAQNNPQA